MSHDPWTVRNPYKLPKGATVTKDLLSWSDAAEQDDEADDKLTWDSRWLSVARLIATWSKDPSTRVGAVCVAENRLIVQGWNGFPRGFDDDPAHYDDRDVKYSYVVHAEKNCIYNACREGICLKGATIYVEGMMVCSQCALGIAQAGIARVVMAAPTAARFKEKWVHEFRLACEIFKKTGVAIDCYSTLGDRYEPSSADWFRTPVGEGLYVSEA